MPLAETDSVTGGNTPSVPFNILLGDCAALPKAFVTLVGLDGHDNNDTVAKLNASSTARGIGIQIKDANGAVIRLGNKTSVPLSSNVMNLNARYVPLANQNIRPGSANANITFTVAFE